VICLNPVEVLNDISVCCLQIPLSLSLSFYLGIKLYVCKQSEVSVIQGSAQFVSSGVVEVNGEQYSANHILIATGGAPVTPNLPGTNYCVNIN